MKTKDVLIIGAGIAGLTLAHLLEKTSYTFDIYDAANLDHNDNSVPKIDYDNLKHPYQCSSFVSNGFINPITGRRFVKSWMIETLLPFALNFYADQSKKLKTDLIKTLPILRYFQDKRSENDWYIKANEPSYKDYYQEKVYHPKGYEIDELSVLFDKSYKLDIKNFVLSSRSYYKDRGVFFYATIDPVQFVINDTIHHPQLKSNYHKVIFCEGYQAYKNLYFDFIPFTSQRGQILDLKVKGLDDKVAVKKKIQVTPLLKDRFSLSTTWDWDVLKPEPTESGKNSLLEDFNKMTDLKYEIVEHKAAVRPTIKDRRPVLGNAPEYRNVFILNGMGSKGASLTPFFANHLLEYIFEQKDLLKEVDVSRYYKYAT